MKYALLSPVVAALSILFSGCAFQKSDEEIMAERRYGDALNCLTDAKVAQAYISRFGRNEEPVSDAVIEFYEEKVEEFGSAAGFDAKKVGIDKLTSSSKAFEQISDLAGLSDRPPNYYERSVIICADPKYSILPANLAGK